jgi:carboxyl-terminal processing protease
MSSRNPLPDARRSPFGGITSGLGSVHATVRLVAIALLLLLTGLTGGMVLERYVLKGSANGPGAFADLEAAATVIEDNYYYLPTDPDERAALTSDMEEKAITGALSALDDTYTRYLPPDESATAAEDLEGRYGGIGVDLAFGDDIVIVANVVPDSPADDAGITRGDVIEEVNGESLAGVDPNEILRKLRGDIGDRVSVTFVRPESGAVIPLDFVLEEIVVPPVTLRFVEGTNIAWLRITIFGDETVAEVDGALAKIREEGATGIVLDLRGNGGGWVESARATLGRFLDPSLGPAMYEDATPGPGGMEPPPIEAGEDVEQTELPMVVLVDGGTASSAEIVAGTLRDYDRAMIIGEPTFGKGSVQRIFGFSDGSTMRVTVAEWFTPSRGRIQDQGIQPDLEISASLQNATDDPVMGAAIRVLKSGQSRPSDLMTAGTPVASPVP